MKIGCGWQLTLKLNFNSIFACWILSRLCELRNQDVHFKCHNHKHLHWESFRIKCIWFGIDKRVFKLSHFFPHFDRRIQKRINIICMLIHSRYRLSGRFGCQKNHFGCFREKNVIQGRKLPSVVISLTD